MGEFPGTPPDEVYEAVARAQAERWGYTSTLDPESLADYVRSRSANVQLRSDLGIAWAAGVAEGRRQAAEAIERETATLCMDGIGRHLIATAAQIARGEQP